MGLPLKALGRMPLDGIPAYQWHDRSWCHWQMADLGVTDKLAEDALNPLSMSPTKMSNQNTSNTNSWGMPFLTHLYLNTKLLPATPASCFLWSPIETYVKSLSLKFKDKYVLWDSVKCFASILIDGSVAPPYSPAVYPHCNRLLYFSDIICP